MRTPTKANGLSRHVNESEKSFLDPPVYPDPLHKCNGVPPRVMPRPSTKFHSSDFLSTPAEKQQ